MATAERIERKPGHRAAWEQARKMILATQDTCAICGKKVPAPGEVPVYHPLHGEVDHIIPVSKIPPGQEYLAWDPSNLQLVHRACNRAKSDKLLAEHQHKVVDEVISNRVLEQHRDWAAYDPDNPNKK